MTPVDTKISPNFNWGELTRTGQSSLQEVNRAEAEKVKAAITALANELLEPIRAEFGPIRINSCFRGPAVNQAVGGSKSSQHMVGEAADIFPLGKGITLEQVFEWIKKSPLKYGQVILECPSPTSRWIHVSLGEPWRKTRNRESLYFDGKSYTPR